jgi:hypothetical protein
MKKIFSLVFATVFAAMICSCGNGAAKNDVVTDSVAVDTCVVDTLVCDSAVVEVVDSVVVE